MSTCYLDDGPAANGRRKVMLATCAYDSPDASYTYAVQASRQALADAGLASAYLLLSGNCHVDDARNGVAGDFLASDCDDLVFLDADVSWRPSDLVRLCEHDRDIVGGVYPYRRKDSRRDLANMPVRCLPGRIEPDDDGLLEVEALPTGFMRIRRGVFEKIEAPLFRMKPQERPVRQFFNRATDAGMRVSGDINFCRKWRATGGKVHADPEIRLGHVAKQVIWGSLGAALRRINGLTLPFVVDRIRTGGLRPEHLSEAWEAGGNPFAASEDVLAFAIGMARKASLPILEIGCGVSTVLMAAATDQTVWCVEHEEYFAGCMERMARRCGVSNIAICLAPLEGGWYAGKDLAELPERFSFAFVDGPPRALGDRTLFFGRMAGRCGEILCDDADEPGYAQAVRSWAGDVGRSVLHHDGRAMLVSGA